jgi:hypothetical protein
MFKKVTIAAAAAATALVALPTAAQARHNDYGRYEQSYDRYADRYGRYDSRYQDRGYDSRYEDSRYDDRTYRSDRRCSGTTGTIVGGAGGALAGRAISRSGSRYSRGGGGLTGTIIGGALGALVGRSVDKSSCNNNSRYYR